MCTVEYWGQCEPSSGGRIATGVNNVTTSHRDDVCAKLRCEGLLAHEHPVNQRSLQFTLWMLLAVHFQRFSEGGIEEFVLHIQPSIDPPPPPPVRNCNAYDE